MHGRTGSEELLVKVHLMEKEKGREGASDTARPPLGLSSRGGWFSRLQTTSQQSEHESLRHTLLTYH